jgi:hypothetical protein
MFLLQHFSSKLLMCVAVHFVHTQIWEKFVKGKGYPIKCLDRHKGVVEVQLQPTSNLTPEEGGH